MKASSNFRCIASFLALLLCVSVSVADDLTWIPFRTGNEPSSPIVTLMESNDDYITLQIITPGVWIRHITGTDDETYEVLTIHNESNVTEIGYPMLPRVPVNVAIPYGATVSVGITTVSDITLNNHAVAPYPSVSTYWQDGIPLQEETYTPNPTIYAQTSIHPYSQYLTREEGMFRNQAVVGLDFSTIRCKPGLEQLEIVDTMEVRVDFSGGMGDAVVDLGIFNAAASAFLINHDMPIAPEPVRPGTVTNVDADIWENDWDLYPCDMLIVTPGQFANDPAFTGKVQSYANLRATLTGFDICIITLGTAANPNDGYLDPADWNFFQENPPPPNHQDFSFMSIRNFVKGLYVNGSANHTGDDRIGFLLLIGDARDEDHIVPGYHDWLIPSPRPFDRVFYTNGGDRHYGCVDGDNPTAPQDEYQDIAVGRLPVGNAEEMGIIYDKTVTYCLNTPVISYRENLLGLCGPSHSFYRNAFKDYALESLFEDGFDIWNDRTNGTNIYGYAHTAPNEYPNWGIFADENRQLPDGNLEPADKNWLAGRINNGVGVLAYFGHGNANSELSFGYYKPSYLTGENPLFNNADKLHVALTYACAVASIDPSHEEIEWHNPRGIPDLDYDGFAEGITVKSLNGAIGFLGQSWAVFGREVDFLPRFARSRLIEQTPCIGLNLLGYMNNLELDPDDEPRFTCHYMGDPTLDIFMPPPPQETTDVTQNTQWSGVMYLANTIRVRNGATLTIAAGTELILNGDIIVEDDAMLLVQGAPQDRVWIHGLEGNEEIVLSEDGWLVFIEYTDLWSLKYAVRCDNHYLWMNNSTIHDCYAGLRFENGAWTDVTENEIYNSQFGIIALDSDVNLELNHIHHVERYGVIALRTSGDWSGNIVEHTLNPNIGTGISIRNSSSPVLWDNYIRFNIKYGVEISGASPTFNFWPGNGNWIYNNYGLAQVYVGTGILDLWHSHNNIFYIDEGYLIYDYNGPTHDVRCNYFGNPIFVNEDRFYPSGYTWSPVDNQPFDFDPNNPPLPRKPKDDFPHSIASEDSVAENLLRQGISAIQDSMYQEATDIFILILEEHASSSCAPAAISHLLATYRLMNIDFSSFDELLDRLMSNNPDRPLRDACDRAHTSFLIHQRNLDDALTSCEYQIAREECGHADSIDILIDMAQILFLMNDEGFEMELDAATKYTPLVSHNRVEFDNVLCKLLEGETLLNSSSSEFGIPNDYYLSQAYPNPFNLTTYIKFGLPDKARVTLCIYDIQGRLVETLLKGEYPAGHHTAIWKSAGIPSGLYIYRLEAGDFNKSRRLTLLK